MPRPDAPPTTPPNSATPTPPAAARRGRGRSPARLSRTLTLLAAGAVAAAVTGCCARSHNAPYGYGGSPYGPAPGSVYPGQQFQGQQFQGQQFQAQPAPAYTVPQGGGFGGQPGGTPGGVIYGPPTTVPGGGGLPAPGGNGDPFYGGDPGFNGQSPGGSSDPLLDGGTGTLPPSGDDYFEGSDGFDEFDDAFTDPGNAPGDVDLLNPPAGGGTEFDGFTDPAPGDFDGDAFDDFQSGPTTMAPAPFEGATAARPVGRPDGRVAQAQATVPMTATPVSRPPVGRQLVGRPADPTAWTGGEPSPGMNDHPFPPVTADGGGIDFADDPGPDVSTFIPEVDPGSEFAAEPAPRAADPNSAGPDPSQGWAHDATFRWVRGVVEYDAASRTWTVLYDLAPPASDPNGGSLTVIDDGGKLVGLEETPGDVPLIVHLVGGLDRAAPPDARGRPRFRLTKANVVGVWE